ncbi:MAG: hypothetical protein K2N87_13375 [Eubacterium sp.]|nr:hypothetical protein [Eubacterium sp.]
MKRKYKDMDKDIKKAQHQDQIAAAVSEAHESEVRRFLTRILQEDEKLFERFQSAVCSGRAGFDLKQYEKKVDAVIREYLGREGFISYREANSFLHEMEAFLKEDVGMMLDDGHHAQAFALSCYIFLKTGSVEIDDSDGGLGMFSERCADIWEEILDEADDKVRREIFEWLIGHLDSGISDYMEEYLERILMDAFSEGDYLKELLAYTKRKAQEPRDGSDRWNDGYHVQKWVLYHIRLMEKAGYGQEEILNYCKEQWEYAKVREYYIEQCMQQKCYDEAIAALHESLRIDAKMPGQVRMFSEKLKEAYRVSGRREDYKQQLLRLVTKDHAGNLEDFRELRGLYDAKSWQAVREEVFLALPPTAHVERLYKEEGLYDRLLEYVLQEKGLYALQQYQDVLAAKYPQQILSKYEKELHEMAARVADRRHYREWANILRRMSAIEGGMDKVHEIVADWRIRYKNRPVMIEELKPFGQQ